MGNLFPNKKPPTRFDMKSSPRIESTESDVDKCEHECVLRDTLETKLIEEALSSIYLDDHTIVGAETFELTQSSNSSSSAAVSNAEIFPDSQIKPFLGQNIEEIRKSAQNFVDPYFKPSIKLITENCRSEFFKSLANSLRVSNVFDLNELARRIIWKKLKVGKKIFFLKSSSLLRWKLSSVVLKLHRLLLISDE